MVEGLPEGVGGCWFEGDRRGKIRTTVNSKINKIFKKCKKKILNILIPSSIPLTLYSYFSLILFLRIPFFIPEVPYGNYLNLSLFPYCHVAFFWFLLLLLALYSFKAHLFYNLFHSVLLIHVLEMPIYLFWGSAVIHGGSFLYAYTLFFKCEFTFKGGW